MFVNKILCANMHTLALGAREEAAFYKDAKRCQEKVSDANQQCCRPSAKRGVEKTEGSGASFQGRHNELLDCTVFLWH